MKFAFVQMNVRERTDRSHEYFSVVIRDDGGFSLVGGKTFVDRDDLIATMTKILASQQGNRTFKPEVLRLIEETGSYSFDGDAALELTVEQAESIGWKE